MSKIKDLDLIENIDILFEKDIIIYGAGNYGKKSIEILEEAGFSVLAVCDSAVEKWGGCFCEQYKIISPIELSKICKEKNIAIIITMSNPEYVKQVLKMLDYCGMEYMDCYTYFAMKYVLSFDNVKIKFSESYRKKIEYVNISNFEWEKKCLLKSDRFQVINELIVSNPIIVYQPSKVGSSTVTSSLVKAGVNVTHTHSINSSWYPEWMMGYKVSQTEEIELGIEILRSLKNVKIITLIREPIGRDISQFFQAFTHDVIMKTKHNVPDILKGLNSFIDDCSSFGELGYEFEWFNNEIKEVFGVDVYKHNFDKEKGYQVIKEKNVEILIIKMEKLNQCEEIISQFVGIDQLKLEVRNAGKDKPYYFTYKNAKEQIKIPGQVIDRYYKNNPAMSHFYTEKEKNDFLRQWKNNIIV